MPRTTEEILAHADELAAVFAAGPTPTDTVETDALEGLSRAVVHAAGAQKAVTAWVTRAREQGKSWSDIGGVLGTSGEAARQRYTAAKKTPAEKTPVKRRAKNVPPKNAAGRAKQRPGAKTR